jgi:aspartate/methionine/tyrosine aminotransferase
LTAWNAINTPRPRYEDVGYTRVTLGHQLTPFQGRPRLKKAIADAYSKSFGRTLNPETEVTITTGANEGEWFTMSVWGK